MINSAPSFVDEYSLDGSGWARFSAAAPGEQALHRYRLGRILKPHLIEVGWKAIQEADPGLLTSAAKRWGYPIQTVVFVMLNPSTADAFKVDPTVRRCVNFAQRWGADILEVVNLFSFRSPHPQDLRDRLRDGLPIGADATNDHQIRAACRYAHRVIVAWGANGTIADRALAVREILMADDVAPLCLGRSPNDGSPVHPLARGKHYIPDDREPVPW